MHQLCRRRWIRLGPTIQYKQKGPRVSIHVSFYRWPARAALNGVGLTPWVAEVFVGVLLPIGFRKALPILKQIWLKAGIAPRALDAVWPSATAQATQRPRRAPDSQRPPRGPPGPLAPQAPQWPPRAPPPQKSDKCTWTARTNR